MRRVALSLSLATTAAYAQEDPHLWLEDVEGEASLAWVRERNASSVEAIAGKGAFTELQDRLLAIYDSTDRIPYVSKQGDWYYNFWRDGEHPKGVWRRTTLEGFLKDEPTWEVLLDLDALGAAEDESWVWKGGSCLPPVYERCLVRLSRGGADATVTREFDLPTRAFVDDGFALEEAKGSVSWIDLDTVYVQTDFGEGSMTSSGYPRITKRWTRGTPLAQAEVIFEGKPEDISVGASHDHTPGFERDFVYRGITFYSNELFELRKGKRVRIDKPDSANASVWREWLMLELRDDWTVDGTTYQAGSLLAAPYDKWMKGKRQITVLFAPTETTSLSGFSPTRHHVLLTTLDDVKNKIEVLTPGKKGWTREALPGADPLQSVSVWAVDADDSDLFFMDVSGYTTPSTLSLGEIGGPPPRVLRSLPAFFDADGLAVTQHFATSKDGTRVPYFQVARADLPMDGTAPTLLYGYGGFEVSLSPGYSAGAGTAWLEKGGVYVVANIRGGGEYGPRWHQAALKSERHRAYEDFIAVGEDLIARGVTTTPHLGIMGGSNGGLLMGNMYTMRPDLWGAVVCRVPLLDMRRYHKLLAGASWMGEYGNPDVPEEWAFIQTFSPYHRIDAGASYPPILFTTSTRDDRVHPGHARKMAAALLELDKDVLYYENIEGGHGGAADNKQSAFMDAMAWTFLWDTLK